MPPGQVIITAIFKNDNGKIAFLASINNATQYGIWTVNGGTISLLALSGQQAPGTGTGVVFTTSINSQYPQLSSTGQVAFLSQVTGTGVTASNNTGLWATKPNGTLVLIARTGNAFTIPGGATKTISTLDYMGIFNYNSRYGSGGSDGRPMGFNNSGQLPLKLTFTDGSGGIFLATVTN